MIEFELKDMTCGHCAGVVRKAISLVDDQAKVEVDVQNQRVKIDSPENPQEFADALTEAGYAPTR